MNVKYTINDVEFSQLTLRGMRLSWPFFNYMNLLKKKSFEIKEKNSNLIAKLYMEIFSVKESLRLKLFI